MVVFWLLLNNIYRKNLPIDHLSVVKNSQGLKKISDKLKYYKRWSLHTISKIAYNFSGTFLAGKIYLMS